MFQRRVLVVEDDALVRSLLCETLAARGFDTHGAGSAVEAKRAVASFDPDAALVDVGLGEGPSGIELVVYLAHAHPEIAPVLLTRQTLTTELDDLPEGVAFLHKSLVNDTDQLVAALEEALRGRGDTIRHDRLLSSRLATLTATQREVLHLIALGYTNTQIALVRGTSVSGVEQTASALFKAMEIAEEPGLSPRVEATRLYVQAVGLPDRPAPPDIPTQRDPVARPDPAARADRPVPSGSDLPA